MSTRLAIADAFGVSPEKAEEFIEKRLKSHSPEEANKTLRLMQNFKQKVNGLSVHHVEAKNHYHFGGQDYERNMRLSSFVRKFGDGTFLVVLKKSLVTVKDGTPTEEISLKAPVYGAYAVLEPGSQLYTEGPNAEVIEHYEDVVVTTEEEVVAVEETTEE